MRIAIAQMRTRAGDFEGASRRMAEQSRAAAEKNVDLLVFPATALCGASPVPYVDREGFLLDLAECLLGPGRRARLPVPRPRAHRLRRGRAARGDARLLGRRRPGAPDVVSGGRRLRGGGTPTPCPSSSSPGRGSASPSPTRTWTSTTSSSTTSTSSSFSRAMALRPTTSRARSAARCSRGATSPTPRRRGPGSWASGAWAATTGRSSAARASCSRRGGSSPPRRRASRRRFWSATWTPRRRAPSPSRLRPRSTTPRS